MHRFEEGIRRHWELLEKASRDVRVFCIFQAFLPNKSGWEKLRRALKGRVDEGAFDKLSDTTRLPFRPGPRQTIAVKVIDPRGNEVMRMHRFGTRNYSEE